jgi:hypothetical protein
LSSSSPTFSSSCSTNSKDHVSFFSLRAFTYVSFSALRSAVDSSTCYDPASSKSSLITQILGAGAIMSSPRARACQFDVF